MSVLKGVFARFLMKAPKSPHHWALLTFSFPRHTRLLASELLWVLFPLPGMPVLPDKLLCILQGPTQMPPRNAPLFFTCAFPAHCTPPSRQHTAQLLEAYTSELVGKEGRSMLTAGAWCMLVGQETGCRELQIVRASEPSGQPSWEACQAHTSHLLLGIWYTHE